MSTVFRTPEEIANDLFFLPEDKLIQTILHVDDNAGDVDFTLSLVKSLLHALKEEEDLTEKDIQKGIKNAKLIKKYDT